MLDKLSKWICRTLAPSLADSLESLAHCQNVASWNLFYSYYFDRYSSELAVLVPLPYSRGGSTRYSSRLHVFSVNIPTCCKDVYVSSFFPGTARLSNSLSIECFLLTCDQIGFKSRIARHLFAFRFFLTRFPVCFNLFVLRLVVTLCFIVIVQLCMEWTPIEKETCSALDILSILILKFKLFPGLFFLIDFIEILT